MVKIRILTMPTCPFCKMAKEFLKEKGIKFEEIDATADREATQKFIKKSGEMGVPQLEINGKMIMGFDKQVWERELKTEI